VLCDVSEFSCLRASPHVNIEPVRSGMTESFPFLVVVSIAPGFASEAGSFSCAGSRSWYSAHTRFGECKLMTSFGPRLLLAGGFRSAVAGGITVVVVIVSGS
jgi:hypothetical protein